MLVATLWVTVPNTIDTMIVMTIPVMLRLTTLAMRCTKSETIMVCNILDYFVASSPALFFGECIQHGLFGGNHGICNEADEWL